MLNLAIHFDNKVHHVLSVLLVGFDLMQSMHVLLIRLERQNFNQSLLTLLVQANGRNLLFVLFFH